MREFVKLPSSWPPAREVGWFGAAVATPFQVANYGKLQAPGGKLRANYGLQVANYGKLRAPLYNMVPYYTIWYHIVQYGTILYNMVPYCTIWYHIV